MEGTFKSSETLQVSLEEQIQTHTEKSSSHIPSTKNSDETVVSESIAQKQTSPQVLLEERTQMDIEKSFSHITPTRNSDEVVSKSTAQKLTSKEIGDNLVVDLIGYFNTDTFSSNARTSTISFFKSVQHNYEAQVGEKSKTGKTNGTHCSF